MRGAVRCIRKRRQLTAARDTPETICASAPSLSEAGDALRRCDWDSEPGATKHSRQTAKPADGAHPGRNPGRRTSANREKLFRLSRLMNQRPDRPADTLVSPAARPPALIRRPCGERRNRSLHSDPKDRAKRGRQTAVDRDKQGSPRPRRAKNAGKARYRSHDRKTRKEFT
jgi:hypothetical protein